jgi:hypothetical protein
LHSITLTQAAHVVAERVSQFNIQLLYLKGHFGALFLLYR